MKSHLDSHNNILLHSLIYDNVDDFIEKTYNNISLINEKNKMGETLLHYASFFGLTEKFITLYNMGATYSKTNKGDTLLHYSLLGGKDYLLFNQLIKDGFSLLEPNNLNITPLHLCKDLSMASSSYQYLQMKYFNFKISAIKDLFGNTPAHTAIQNNHLEVFHFFTHQEESLKNELNNLNQKPFDISTAKYQVCPITF